MDWEIVEDEASRTALHRARCEKQLKLLRVKHAPQILIEVEEKKLAMTYTEHKNWCKRQEIDHGNEHRAYAKNNPMNEEVVSELFKRYDKMSETYDSVLDSSIRFNMELESRELMSEADWYYGLYEPLIDSLQDQYVAKYKDKFEEDYSRYQ